jgi:hypothetical protein
MSRAEFAKATHKAWNTLQKHSGSLGAYGNCEKHEGSRVLFIGPEKQRTSGQGAYVRGSCPVVQWLPRTSMDYLEGIQKVAYTWWSHVRLHVPFAECTSSGPPPPPYVRITDNNVRPPDLAYVCPKVQITLLVSLVTQSSN